MVSLILFSIFASLSSYTAPAAGNLPTVAPFDFKGQRFDQSVDMSLPEFKFCKSVAQDRLNCRSVTSVSGIFATLDYKVYRGKAYFLSITMPRSFYSKAVAAFTVKYGKPCEVTEIPWQNSLGMKQRNAVTMYCMATGKFVALAIGEKVDEMRAVYIDDNNLPPENAPKVDF